MRRALVVGRSAGVMEDYAAARALCEFDDVIVVGKMGEVFPDRIDYWVSFHVPLFDKWAATRAQNALPSAAHYWGPLYKGQRLGEGATACRPISFVDSIGGSSGFLAVWGALHVCADDLVVLAGVPMAARDQHYAGAASSQELGVAWAEADAYWTTWDENMAVLRGRVRSMSGRTRDVLGYPDVEWLGHGS